MTEAEWLACTDPRPMLEFLQGRAGARKLWLLSSACCRRVWHLLESTNLHMAVDALERYADGAMDAESFRSVAFAAHPLAAYRDEVFSGQPREEKWFPAYGIHHAMLFLDSFFPAKGSLTPLDDFALAVGAARGERPGAAPLLRRCEAECAAQAGVIREVFGNPWRPVSFDSACLHWGDGIIVKLATAIYEERALPAGTLDSARLAVLADALEEAGCTDAGTLGHCRSGGEHVRGCWLVDLLTGRG